MKQPEPAEVCIIGGGVAGAMLAFQLARSGIEVLILEAGPRHDPAERFEYMRQHLYGGDPWASNNPARDQFTLGGPYRWFNLNQNRVKAVGGSGLHWGGHVGRLHESDFELHSRYGIGIDWPFRYGDLEPYYTQAEQLIGVAGEDAYPLTPWRSQKYPLPPFPFSYSDRILKTAFDQLGIPMHHTAVARTSIAYDGRPPCLSYAMCQTCPIFAKWTPDLLLAKAEETGKVTVKSDTRVCRINCNKLGTAVESVTAASIVNGQLRYSEHRADVFTIAAHTVESARLLLLSASASHPDGLGGGYVGKYLMEHPVVLGRAELRERTYPERIGFETAESHYLYESSREQGGTAFVLVPANSDVQSPLDIVNEELSRHLIWGNELKAVVQRRFGSGALIGAILEQLPYEENRVSLDKRVRDDLGAPVPKMTYLLNQERELRTIERASLLIRRVFEALDATDIRMRTVLAPGHQMGTCRMGNDAKSCVVDPDLKLHGIDNLYIAGSSVFPTSGAVWPTLTVAALALRLGNHLRSKLRHTDLPSTRGRDDTQG
jgi:choline dehydrogenase-like flavoprotein